MKTFYFSKYNTISKYIIVQFIEKTLQTWRVELTAGRQSLEEVKVQRGILQGDALSPILFLVSIIPLNHILRKCKTGYELSEAQKKDRPLNVHGGHQTF